MKIKKEKGKTKNNQEYFLTHQSKHMTVLGVQKNRLIETVLFSTHNICFGREIRKIVFNYTFIWRPEYALQILEEMKWRCSV